MTHWKTRLIGCQSSAWLLVTAVVVVTHCSASTPSLTDFREDKQVMQVRAVLGQQVVLPCDVHSAVPNDPPQLVLWYRHNSNIPFYSVDYRSGDGATLSDGTHLRSKDTMVGRRVRFDARRLPTPALVLKRAQPEDVGDYRCRLDFTHSPTRHADMHLSLIIPPETPVIRLATSGAAVGNEIGPLEEGDSLSLLCQTRGGDPAPSLSWWQHGQQIEFGSTLAPSAGVYTSSLVVAAISRQNSLHPLVCRASNNNISAPLNASVQINAHFQPSYVRLVGENRPLSLGKVSVMKCVTEGSRPQADLNWWLDNRQLMNHTVKRLVTGEQRSVLVLNATLDMDGRTLSCRANNPQLPDAPLEQSWRLSVHYAPRVQLQFGSVIQADSIKAGENVFLDCHVTANPKIHRIEWLHNGGSLRPDRGAGVLFSNMSLVLQHVSPRAAGQYACRVTNSQQTTTSNSVQLHVRHAPVCDSDQKLEYRMSADPDGNMSPPTGDDGVETSLLCHLLANPGSMTASWQINTTDGWRDLNSSWYRKNITSVSKLSLPADFKLPAAAADGSWQLRCWASNSVGSNQHRPCVLKLLPSDTNPPKPQPPRSCRVHNRTSTSLHVRCDPAAVDSAVLPLTYYLEVYRVKSRVLLFNTSGHRPDFIVTNLQPGEQLSVHVFSSRQSHLRGRRYKQALSERVTLEAVTQHTAELKAPQDDMDPGSSSDSSGGHSDRAAVLHLTTVLGALVGVTLALLLVALVVVLTRRNGGGGGVDRRRHTCLSGCSTRSTPSTSAIVDADTRAAAARAAMTASDEFLTDASLVSMRRRQRLHSYLTAAAAAAASGDECHDKMLAAMLKSGSTAASDCQSLASSSAVRQHAATSVEHCSPDVVPPHYKSLLAPELSVAGKGYGDCYMLDRSTPFSDQSTMSISETLGISSEAGLPHRLHSPITTNSSYLQHCPASVSGSRPTFAPFCRPPSMQMPPSLITLPSVCSSACGGMGSGRLTSPSCSSAHCNPSSGQQERVVCAEAHETSSTAATEPLNRSTGAWSESIL